MPKNESNQPIFKDRVGGLSVSAWQYSAVIQQRKPVDANNPKGEWSTVAELKGLNKKQCEELGKILIAASKEMSAREFNGKGKTASKKTSNDENEGDD